jgi:hypothetical protein
MPSAIATILSVFCDWFQVRTCPRAGFFNPFGGEQRRRVPPGPVGRCSWAGDAANLDAEELVREHLERDRGIPALPEGDDPRAIAAYLKEFDRHLARLPLRLLARREPEERRLIADDALPRP